MSEQSQHETHRCGSVGYLLVAGKRVGLLRCELDVGHETIDSASHRASLEWTNDDALAESWPEALDVDETFDIEVPVDLDEALDRKQDEVFRERGWRGEIPHDYDGTPHSA